MLPQNEAWNIKHWKLINIEGNIESIKEYLFLQQGVQSSHQLCIGGNKDVRAVLVLYKHCPYFRGFVGICFDLVLMWKP